MGSALYEHYTNGNLKSEGGSVSEGIGQGRITANLEGLEVDFPVQVTDAQAMPILFDLLDKEGLLLGGSSAINVAGAAAMAREMGPGHTICTILCDSGQRYQSKIWNPEFLRAKDLPVPYWLRSLKGRNIMQTTIVSAEWLLAQDSDKVTILDASYFLPTMGRDGRAEFAQEHIIGAQFFDIDAIKDEDDPLPHMMPLPLYLKRQCVILVCIQTGRLWSMITRLFIFCTGLVDAAVFWSSGGMCSGWRHGGVETGWRQDRTGHIASRNRKFYRRAT